jgi:hypothetical protein
MLFVFVSTQEVNTTGNLWNHNLSLSLSKYISKWDTKHKHKSAWNETLYRVSHKFKKKKAI